MSEGTVPVTRKGQVTIPTSKRKKYGIREGMRVLVKESNDGIPIKPITPIEDLAGVDAHKVSLEEMRKRLDEMRRSSLQEDARDS
jgi:AbrB family looped-hinge helix DNA binding protein